MKKLSKLLIISVLFSSVICGCSKKEENPFAYDKGFFPDSVLNLDGLNSPFDDYNLNILSGNSPVVFSSNRLSEGGQFDIVQGEVSFMFDKTGGYFEILTTITDDAFLNILLSKVNTSADEFGPYRFFSRIDGYEYTVVSSPDTDGKHEFRFYKNRPKYGLAMPDIQDPLPVSLLNSDYNDAYFCFDQNQDSAYFCSDRSGNFDIYLQPLPEGTEVADWFRRSFSASVLVDSLNSASQDKCPLTIKNVMVFASDRPGGLGGFDLYYSIFKKGKWSSPVNMGPGINTASNEYRPVLGTHPDFTNYFMMFSSDRPGGKGGYDLYFTGIDFK